MITVDDGDITRTRTSLYLQRVAETVARSDIGFDLGVVNDTSRALTFPLNFAGSAVFGEDWH